MDYLNYYGLSQEPFSVMPVTKFYYHSEQHDRALEKLQYAVHTMKGLAVLVGDLGTGKTTLARRLLDSLHEDEFEASLLVIVHSDVDAKWLLKRIAMQLGVENPAESKVDILAQLYERLVALAESGKKAVVLIDEAQMLKSAQLMEEFRGLLNLELNDQKLLSFVFFGLPELEYCLKNDAPLAQRVAVKHRLYPFTPDTTSAYIHHRLSLAGVKTQLFTNNACELVHDKSNDVPRLINVICDNSLFEGYIRRVTLIDDAIVSTVADDLGI